LATCITVICLSTGVFAQTLDDCFRLARQHEAAGNKEAALDYFQRVIYFDNAQIYLKEALLSTANLYFNDKDFDRAAAFYHRAMGYYEGAEQRKISFQIITCHLTAQQYMAALEELLALELELETKEEKNYFLFLKGTTHLGLSQTPEAREAFMELVSQVPEWQSEVETIFRKLTKAERRNEKAAYFMSAAFPGLGQLYAHDYRNGLNVFFLSSGFLALTIYSALTISPTAALLNVIPWWSRYHIGGMTRAQDSVRQYKVKQRAKQYKKLYDLYMQTSPRVISK
jgi:tetratricopeptide (TPR) repeat protein